MWGIKKTMRVRHYYDGPVKNTGRSLEEIERDIQKETEKCDKMNEWENPDQDKQKTTSQKWPVVFCLYESFVLRVEGHEHSIHLAPEIGGKAA